MAKKYEIFLSPRELFWGSLLFLLIALIVAGPRWWRLYDGDAISPPSEEPVHIYLDEQTNFEELAEMLSDSGVVEDVVELEWAAKVLGWQRFREGHYLIDDGFTYNQFLSKLARGAQDPVSVTIIPGSTKARIADAVSQDLQFDSLAFHQVLTDSAVLEELNVDPEDIIGRLYPNTYSMYWTSSPRSFLERILNEFDRQVVQTYREEFNSIESSVDEIITLASIIQWEARNDEEKQTISGLYWNRLDRGMRLQADPTVIYAIGEQRRILYEDYQIDHEYNTYRYDGLPPGPITNPGLSSIEAALNPEEHDYLYMVATPNGGHAFSETFEEHKQKSAQWRQWLREQYRIKREREQNSQ